MSLRLYLQIKLSDLYHTSSEVLLTILIVYVDVVILIKLCRTFEML